MTHRFVAVYMKHIIDFFVGDGGKKQALQRLCVNLYIYFIIRPMRFPELLLLRCLSSAAAESSVR